MILHHAKFIDAIRGKTFIRVVFYSIPDAGKVDRECIPLDFGPEPGAVDVLNRYWIWDHANTAGANPLGLLPDQIVSVQVLGRNFIPQQLALGNRSWNVIRDWEVQRELHDPSETTKK